MKEKMLRLIKASCHDESSMEALVNIYELYDQLQYSENLKETADMLFIWLNKKYSVDNINFSIFNIEQNTTTVILKKGDDFFLDGEHSFYFIINTHTEINAVVSFNASSQKHYDKIYSDNDYIESAFFQVSPIIQNGIMKKHHVEASSIDSVTNVYNRKYLVEHINKLISLSNKQEESITFLMIGIDHFKAVIDEFDYDIGDKVLIELAKVIHSNIKDFDIVARLSGDEFLVALVNLSSSNIAQTIAERVIKEFAQVEVVVNEETLQTLKKTICVGISSYPQDGSNIDQVLKNADIFLYEAKNKGRSSYAVYKKDEESSIDLF